MSPLHAFARNTAANRSTTKGFTPNTSCREPNPFGMTYLVSDIVPVSVLLPKQTLET